MPAVATILEEFGVCAGVCLSELISGAKYVVARLGVEGTASSLLDRKAIFS